MMRLGRVKLLSRHWIKASLLVLLVHQALFAAYIPDEYQSEGLVFTRPLQPTINAETSSIEIGSLQLHINRNSCGIIRIEFSELSNGITRIPYSIRYPDGAIYKAGDGYCYHQHGSGANTNIGTLTAILPYPVAAIQGFRSSIIFKLILH